MPETLREAYDALNSFAERRALVVDLSIRTQNHVAEFGLLGEDQNPNKLADRVFAKYKGKPGFIVLATTVHPRTHRGASVVGFESEGLNRFMLMPAGGDAQVFDEEFKGYPLIFPGRSPSFVEIKEADELFKRATRGSLLRKKERFYFEYQTIADDYRRLTNGRRNSSN